MDNMADRSDNRAYETPLEFFFEKTLATAKHMSAWKLLLVCVLASEAFTFILSLSVCYAWLGEFPKYIMIVGVIDSFAVSLVVCAVLVSMLVRLRESDRSHSEDKRLADAMLASIKDAVCILDTSYNVLYQNDVHKFLNGSHVGQVCYSAYRNRQEPCDLCPVEMAIRDGGFHRVEKRVNTSAGLRHLDMSASPILDESGEVGAVIEVIRDLTEHKRAESAAGIGEEMYRQVTEKLGAAAWLGAGHGGRVLYISPALSGMLGRATSKVYSDPEFLALYAHEDDAKRVRGELRKSARGEAVSFACRIIGADGGLRTVQAEILPLEDELGEISRVVGVLRDADA